MSGELEELVRKIAAEVARRPEFVTQRTVKAVVGLEPRAYLRGSAAGNWATTREQRLVVARTADVLAYFETRLQAREARPANDHDPEAMAFSRVGARRVSR